MNTPYVKITTVRKFQESETIIGYRPSLVITNKWGNQQTVHMGMINPLQYKTYDTPEEAQQAYDDGRIDDYRPMGLKYPELDTNELQEIADGKMWRVI